MKDLYTEITINATAEKVWGILTDFEQYPSWNPFIIAITGQPVVGTRLRVELKNGNNVSVFKPRVMAANTGKEFEWLGSLPIPGVFNGQHFFRISPAGNNSIKFVQGEHFSGLLAGVIMGKIGAQTRQSFIAMNEALKKRAEA
ncbi:MAG TPA: SRPBCC domain-containing protein [Chitinophagales bacterium]|nr:SRPBCC domain-containing protein [Chitinophagales bacterium]